MSILDEVRQAWHQKFLDEELPDIWHEKNIWINLEEHRKQLERFKYEMKKEEFIVRHLEQILTAVQFRNQNATFP